MKFALTGNHVVLEPLERSHADGLAAASAVDPALYALSPVPQGRDAMLAYIDTAIAWRDAGTAQPFAVIRKDDGTIIGSTRFFDLERWAWPPDHPLHSRDVPDVGEIGYTWYTASAIRTAANTEAKLLMLTHAFEIWNMRRICLHTDVRNTRSRNAIERIGGTFEGILRAHRIATDATPRDSARYSIVSSEWPDVKEKLQHLTTRQS